MNNFQCVSRGGDTATYAVAMAASPAVSAVAIAAEIRRQLPGVGAKKLHKLLYYCQGHHLAATGDPLFRETISAWDMGPVVGQLWRSEKDVGISPDDTDLDEGQLNTVGYVLSRYGALSGHDLEALTHSETPWRRADEARPPGETARIEKDWLVEFFRSGAALDDEDLAARLDETQVRNWLAGSTKPEPGAEDTMRALSERLRG